MGVNNAMLARLHRQLQESRGQVDQLVASSLEFRVKELEAAEERAAERDGDARTTLSGLLELTVPAAWGERLARRLGAALVSGPTRVVGTATLAVCLVRLRSGMRSALPLGALGSSALQRQADLGPRKGRLLRFPASREDGVPTAVGGGPSGGARLRTRAQPVSPMWADLALRRQLATRQPLLRLRVG